MKWGRQGIILQFYLSFVSFVIVPPLAASGLGGEGDNSFLVLLAPGAVLYFISFLNLHPL